jgi:hypothetical protein
VRSFVVLSHFCQHTKTRKEEKIHRRLFPTRKSFFFWRSRRKLSLRVQKRERTGEEGEEKLHGAFFFLSFD